MAFVLLIAALFVFGDLWSDRQVKDLVANVMPANDKFTAHFAQFLEDGYQVEKVFVLPPQDGDAGLYVSAIVMGASDPTIGVWFFSGNLRNPLGMAGSLDQTAERVSVLLRWQRASKNDLEARAVRAAAEAAMGPPPV